MNPESTIHSPIAAGILYPSEAAALDGAIDSLMAEGAELLHAAAASAPLPADRDPAVLIVPHAAYQYAGRLIGAAFSALLPGPGEKNGAVRRVVLLSALHRDNTSAALLPAFNMFRTPAGELNVDTDMVEELLAHDSFTADETSFSEEHAQEVILPFIERCLPNAAVLPILLGDNSPELARRTSEALQAGGVVPGGDTLFVISTNLSRFVSTGTAVYHSQRFVQVLTDDAGPLQDSLDAIARSSACGIGAVRTAVLCCGKDLRFYLISTASSGPLPPEQREVQYGSLCGYLNKSRQEE